MAKEKSAARKKAGKAAWRKRVARARAEGKTHVKVGNRRVAIGGGKSKKAQKSGSRPKKRSSGDSESRAKRVAAGKKAARTRARNADGGTKKSRKRSRKVATSTKIVTRTRIKKVKGPRRTKTIITTRYRTRKGTLMDNPLSGTEMLAGGLTLLLGLGVADFTDRLIATHALTADSNGNQVDKPAVDSNGNPTQLSNGAAVMAPMNLKRWGAGAGLVIVPFVGAAFAKKSPTLRSALQLFGFGAFARVGGKGLKDLYVKLTGKTPTTERLFANEIAGYNLNEVLKAATVSGYTASPIFQGTTQVPPPPPGLGHGRFADMTRSGHGGGDGYGAGGGRGGLAGCACGGSCSKCKGQTQQVQPPQPPPANFLPPPPPPAQVQPPAPVPVPVPVPVQGGGGDGGGGQQPPAPPPPTPHPAGVSRPLYGPRPQAANNPYRRGDAAKLQ